MSDSEEESFCFFGSALEPYDEDTFPKKRPITVEEQIATDAHGRRRFHGAFTGGFSAGFFNTVGSLEGWTPSEFKSSRDEKAVSKLQNPEDYMDDEDLGEFGIAPQRVKATSDYSTSKKKRKRQVWSDGPIPGEPVLETLLNSGNETIGYLLLKNMGINKKLTVEDNSGEANKEEKKIYGCEMPKQYEISRAHDLEDNLHELYKEYLKSPKSNTFGLGYVGLDKSHINLFHSTNLVVKERNNKKLSISGQAFGVGAFEDEDEDIYVKDDMNKYDFELTSESKKPKSVPKIQDKTVLNDFTLSKQKLVISDFYPPPIIPQSFSGKHNIRRSRFEPLVEDNTKLERKSINATVRAKYLGEDVQNKTFTPSNTQHIKTKEKDAKVDSKNSSLEVTASKNSDLELSANKNASFEGSDLLFDRFVSASQTEDISNILEFVQPSETLHGTEEMRSAAKMKMFGPLTRVILNWQPSPLLCKRFNVPELHASDLSSQKNKKRTKHLIFEYQKHDEQNSEFKPGLSSQFIDKVVETAAENSDNKKEGSIETLIVESSVTKEIVANDEKSLVIEEKTQVALTVTKDITEKINVSENTDLFKAIFLSSSESEDEDEAEIEETVKEDRNEVMKINILTDQLIPKIKTKKDGILSNVDFTQFKTTTINTDDKHTNGTEETIITIDDSAFGPKLPDKVSKSVTINQPVDNDDSWIEKEFAMKKIHKHKHKHKNKRDKHKSKKGKSYKKKHKKS